jgi:hypothetical protein
MPSHSIEEMAPTAIKARSREWQTFEPNVLELAVKLVSRDGIVQPPIVDSQSRIVCGELFVRAARVLRLNSIPVLRAGDLTDHELRRYAIAADRLAHLLGYDETILAEELRELEQLLECPDFADLGFEPAELDRILKLTASDLGLADEEPKPQPDALVTRLGDCWHIGRHRLLCSDALNGRSYEALMADELARFSLVDAPYNRPADAISGNGRFKHDDFLMAAGELSPAEFTRFLTKAMRHISRYSTEGSLHAFFMSYHFLLELLRAGSIVYGRPKAICTWVKRSGGQGSLFRSQTEFVAYFKKGSAPHQNNVQLGRFGRNRTTAWMFDGMNTLSKERDELLEGHPTPKPVELLSDAILDVTSRDDIVLDPFAGSGSLIVAAQAVERRAFCMELDPIYVDVALRRCRKAFGIDPIRESDGAAFSQLEARLFEDWEARS